MFERAKHFNLCTTNSMRHVGVHTHLPPKRPSRLTPKSLRLQMGCNLIVVVPHLQKTASYHMQGVAEQNEAPLHVVDLSLRTQVAPPVFQAPLPPCPHLTRSHPITNLQAAAGWGRRQVEEAHHTICRAHSHAQVRGVHRNAGEGGGGQNGTLQPPCVRSVHGVCARACVSHAVCVQVFVQSQTLNSGASAFPSAGP